MFMRESSRQWHAAPFYQTFSITPVALGVATEWRLMSKRWNHSQRFETTSVLISTVSCLLIVFGVPFCYSFDKKANYRWQLFAMKSIAYVSGRTILFHSFLPIPVEANVSDFEAFNISRNISSVVASLHCKHFWDFGSQSDKTLWINFSTNGLPKFRQDDACFHSWGRLHTRIQNLHISLVIFVTSCLISFKPSF